MFGITRANGEVESLVGTWAVVIFRLFFYTIDLCIVHNYSGILELQLVTLHRAKDRFLCSIGFNLQLPSTCTPHCNLGKCVGCSGSIGWGYVDSTSAASVLTGWSLSRLLQSLKKGKPLDVAHLCQVWPGRSPS